MTLWHKVPDKFDSSDEMEPNVMSLGTSIKCWALIYLLRLGKFLGWRRLIWNTGARLYWYPSYPRGDGEE